MPTRYFKNSVDQNWDTLGNWWANAACDEGFAGTLTGVTVTDTDTEVTCDSTAGLVVGRPITGTGIDTGSTVASITDGTTFELSLPAIANGSSNLTCELHVIPVTADDVVIATGNNAVAGTPSADVLGLVTVNGNSALNVTLEAANFEFYDYSFNEETITGNCTFYGNSRNSWGNITGNCTFNDSSYNGNSSTISGDCTFNDSSYNASGGTINSGIFNGTSYNTGTGYDATFNGSSWNDGGTLTNATFTEAEYSTALTGRPNPQQGTVSGTVTFSSVTPVKFTLVGSETWTANTYAWPNYWVFTTPGHNWEFNDYSSMGDGIESTQEYGAGLVFNDNSVNYKYVWMGDFGDDATVVFNDSSINTATGSLELYGTVTFNHQSHNVGSLWGGSGPTITFNDDSVHESSVAGRWSVGTYHFRDNSYIASGAIVGSIYQGTSTVYFYDQSRNQSSGYYGPGAGYPYDNMWHSVQPAGHTYIRQHAADLLAWIDYFNTGSFQSTLHLQFPEMDILGTGLL